MLQGKQYQPVTKGRFLAAYAKCGIIGEAARMVNIPRQQHYAWMADPEYQRLFAEAGEKAVERLEAELYNRIHEGTEEPVIYQGELCYQKDKAGKLTDKPLTVRRKSDTLLIFALKGNKPEKYRDNFKGEIVHTGAMEVNHRLNLKSLSDEQLEQLESMFSLNRVDEFVQPAGRNGTGEPDLCGRAGGEAETETQ